MGEYTFLDLAEDVLRKELKPLSAKEIWQNSIKLNIVDKIKTKGKTPWNSIAAQLYIDIRDNDLSIFVQSSKRPAKFYLKDLEEKNDKSSEKQIDATQSIEMEEKKFHERDLHPLLVAYTAGNTHFRAYLKTVYHENSSKRKTGQNKWLHPDLVGVYFPFKEYDRKLLDLQSKLASSLTKIFSFEMKIELNMSNLREYYFQTVSNSSWANEGYIVVLKLDEDSEFMDELRRLNNAFGIGLIKLNIENINSSEILLPAKINPNLDWATINRLAEDNSDFKDFLEDVNADILVGKAKSSYDDIINDIVEYIKEKKISL